MDVDVFNEKWINYHLTFTWMNTDHSCSTNSPSMPIRPFKHLALKLVITQSTEFPGGPPKGMKWPKYSHKDGQIIPVNSCLCAIPQISSKTWTHEVDYWDGRPSGTFQRPSRWGVLVLTWVSDQLCPQLWCCGHAALTTVNKLQYMQPEFWALK